MSQKQRRGEEVAYQRVPAEGKRSFRNAFMRIGDPKDRNIYDSDRVADDPPSEEQMRDLLASLEIDETVVVLGSSLVDAEALGVLSILSVEHWQWFRNNHHIEIVRVLTMSQYGHGVFLRFSSN